MIPDTFRTCRTPFRSARVNERCSNAENVARQEIDINSMITLYYIGIVDYGSSARVRVVSLASMAAGIGTSVKSLEITQLTYFKRLKG